MDDVGVGQSVPASDHALARVDRRVGSTFFGQTGSGSPIDRPGYPTAGQQLRICRVDYCIHIRLSGNVSLRQLNRHPCHDLMALCCQRTLLRSIFMCRIQG